MASPDWAGPEDPSEHPPHPDRVVQGRIWQERLIRMARRGHGSPAQLLAGRLLAEHGTDARRVLHEAPPAPPGLCHRADSLLAGCGLAPWGPSTHHAEQEKLL